MINEEIKSEVFRTRMLTNYREDWPNGRKGCLWFIHGRNGRNNHVILLDTFWRKGYEWQKDDEMLRTLLFFQILLQLLFLIFSLKRNGCLQNKEKKIFLNYGRELPMLNVNVGMSQFKIIIRLRI